MKIANGTDPDARSEHCIQCGKRLEFTRHRTLAGEGPFCPTCCAYWPSVPPRHVLQHERSDGMKIANADDKLWGKAVEERVAFVCCHLMSCGTDDFHRILVHDCEIVRNPYGGVIIQPKAVETC